MNDQAKPISRHWRSFLRFSVRGLIVLVLVIGGWLGWIVRTHGFSARLWRQCKRPAGPYGTTGNGSPT